MQGVVESARNSAGTVVRHLSRFRMNPSRMASIQLFFYASISVLAFVGVLVDAVFDLDCSITIPGYMIAGTGMTLLFSIYLMFRDGANNIYKIWVVVVVLYPIVFMFSFVSLVVYERGCFYLQLSALVSLVCFHIPIISKLWKIRNTAVDYASRQISSAEGRSMSPPGNSSDEGVVTVEMGTNVAMRGQEPPIPTSPAPAGYSWVLAPAMQPPFVPGTPAPGTPVPGIPAGGLFGHAAVHAAPTNPYLGKTMNSTGWASQ